MSSTTTTSTAVEREIEGAACVFVEPVAGNMGVVPPADGFLEGLRRLCDESGALLVFDEVITGFRVARGGAQERFGVLPDLTVLGKIVGGGLPLAAFGGRAELMERLAPAGDVYQAGTLSGNPLATAAGLSVLRRLTPEVYEELEAKGRRLDALGQYGRFERVGAMATLFVDDYPALFRHLLERGIYLAPSQNEAMFLSTAHGDEEIDRTIEAVADFAHPGQASASRRRVSIRCSGSTFTSARTGMKFVSPAQRGTTWRWTWSTIPAPAMRPRFQPRLWPCAP